MKTIRYLLSDGRTEKEIRCGEAVLESNLATARKEAFNGAVTVTDDGIPETVTPDPLEDTDALLIDHEYRLTLLELGLTESGVSE